MDFIISNVTTVEEDDAEPLLEVKKVAVIKDQPKSEVRRKTYSKSCYVPLCPNSTIATPEKMFITVPVNPERRRQWFKVVGRSTEGKNPKSPLFCCEDHFDLEKDMKNYKEHLRMGKVQMLLHRTTVPHLFLCNQYGHLKRKDRIRTLQILHKKQISGALTEGEMVELEQLSQNSTNRKGFRVRKRKLHETEFIPKETVFVEIPNIDYEDKPENVQISKDCDGIDTIVIEDSDSEDK